MAKQGTNSTESPLLPHPSTPHFTSTSEVPDREPQDYILLPTFPRGRRRSLLRYCRCSSSLLASATVLALLGLVLFFIWPSKLEMRTVRLKFDRVRVSTQPAVAVSIDLHLRIRIRNPNFFAFHYDGLFVAVGYRGEPIGYILSAGGKVKARGASYVDVELQIDGVQVLHNVFYLIEDLIRRSIQFDTITEVKGFLHILFFDIPIKGEFSCSVDVNPENQTTIKQYCYPE
ncbi:hypothetical protein HPP92_019946 [Vanilla planifolia]|uniref:Water stress and hypersensitive response domain-containing protein n=1 Tax=Vanilla planifolia TaxID=51239 RepID=A0A835QAM9_VANPL|nr:hypothetical protein HPP92_019946 [Vanilla planifolia]